jgi:hypothetical protein
MVNALTATERDIVRAINSDAIDSASLMSREGWKRICQVRGRYFGQVDALAWTRLCARRGYAQGRQNPRGF